VRRLRHYIPTRCSIYAYIPVPAFGVCAHIFVSTLLVHARLAVVARRVGACLLYTPILSALGYTFVLGYPRTWRIRSNQVAANVDKVSHNYCGQSVNVQLIDIGWT
jgi:hypothetical protein